MHILLRNDETLWSNFQKAAPKAQMLFYIKIIFIFIFIYIVFLFVFSPRVIVLWVELKEVGV